MTSNATTAFAVLPLGSVTTIVVDASFVFVVGSVATNADVLPVIGATVTCAGLELTAVKDETPGSLAVNVSVKSAAFVQPLFVAGSVTE